MRYAVEQNGMLVWIDTDAIEEAKKAGQKPMTREEQIASIMQEIKNAPKRARELGLIK